MGVLISVADECVTTKALNDDRSTASGCDCGISLGKSTETWALLNSSSITAYENVMY